MRRAGAGLVVLVALAGCDRDAPSSRSPTGAVAGPTAPSDEDGAFARATGQGETSSASCQAATQQLAQRILGDARWLDLVPVDLGHGPVRAEPDAAGGFTCAVSLGESQAVAALVEFEHARPRIVGPASWRDALYGVVAAHQARHACARRAELFDVRCTAPSTEDADAALSGLAAGVSLAPVYLGGVPADAEGRLLRRPGVLVMFHGVPIADVPLTVGEGTQAHRLSTDERGVARTGQRGEPWSRQTVVVDAEALLGPLAHRWPPDAVVLQTRPVDARRWVVVNAHSTPDAFGAALAQRLTRAGLSKPVDVDAAMRTSLQQGAVDYPVLADLLGGRLDVVFIASVQSRFAGRASGSRVWHEAVASVTARNVWTGRVLATVEAKIKATGEGDDAAAVAARRLVLDPLVRELLSSAAIPIPADLRP